MQHQKKKKKRTLYSQTKNGGILFRSERRPGDVRIPNYVYDIWMPLIGAEALGVYGVYCRLEMNGGVRKITLQDLANACRIGKAKLYKTNDKLIDCGFVRINKPTGAKRLMHWTTEIIVLDPPQEVPQEIIEKYAPGRGYQMLTPWLLDGSEVPDGTSESTNQYSDEVPNGTSESTNQYLDEVPDGTSNIVSLDIASLDDLQSLNNESASAKTFPNSESNNLVSQPESREPQNPQEPESQGPKPTPTETDPPTDYLDTLFEFAKHEELSWTVTPEAGGADPFTDGPVTAFCALVKVDPEKLGSKDKTKWARKLRQIAEHYHITATQMETCIRAIPKTDYAWRASSFTNPYASGFKDVVSAVILRYLSGTLPVSDGNGDRKRGNNDDQKTLPTNRKRTRQWTLDIG